MSFSVLILTLNEEDALPGCLESIRDCDDIVVLDSFSKDRTEEIARAAGARFFPRKFDHFAGQRNWGLTEIEYKHPWVFHLDADERFTPELAAECAAKARDPAHDGYYVPSKMMFMGRWLKHAASYPAYQMRFARKDGPGFVQHGHGQRESDAARIGYIQNPLIHHSFSKGLADWFERHNRYSTDEAAQCLKELEENPRGSGAILSRDPIARRRALKSLASRLPFRPTLKFLYLYILRRGFLDGGPGLAYCRLQAFYEYMIALKMKEARRKKRGLPI